jgi:hypothetical protein
MGLDWHFVCWTILHTTRDYNLQNTITHELMYTIVPSVPLFSSEFQDSNGGRSPSFGFRSVPVPQLQQLLQLRCIAHFTIQHTPTPAQDSNHYEEDDLLQHQSYVTRLVGQAVLVPGTRLQPMVRFRILSDSFGLVDVGCPLWRKDGAVVYNCCGESPALSFSCPIPLGHLFLLGLLKARVRIKIKPLPYNCEFPSRCSATGVSQYIFGATDYLFKVNPSEQFLP